jgi:hypothetical protein
MLQRYAINKIKEFIHDESGAAFIWLLIFSMIFMYIWTFDVDTVNMMAISKQIENNLEIAALAAAEATEASMAAGTPLIDPVEADNTFRELLSENFKLDPATLVPAADSRLKSTPTYNLYVYNGPFPSNYTDPITGETFTLTEPSVVASIREQYDHLVRNKTNFIVRSIVAKVHHI